MMIPSWIRGNKAERTIRSSRGPRQTQLGVQWLEDRIVPTAVITAPAQWFTGIPLTLTATVTGGGVSGASFDWTATRDGQPMDLSGIQTHQQTLAFVPSDDGTYHFQVHVSVPSNGGPGVNDHFGSASTSVVTNRVPTANARGPYTVVRGSSIQIVGSYSTDPDAPIDQLSYAWDLDNDGQFDDSSFPDFSYSTVGLDSLGSRTIALRVTDLAGHSSTATTTLEVVTHLLVPDIHQLYIGCGMGSDNVVVGPAGDSAINVTLNGSSLGDFPRILGMTVYAQAGDDSVVVSASPSMGVAIIGDEGSDIYTVNLPHSCLINDFGTTGTDTLLVNGTTAGDDIDITEFQTVQWRPNGELELWFSEINFFGIEQATLNAGAGDDIVTDPESTNLTILGGPGNDTITIAETVGAGVTADGGDGSDTYIIEAANLQGPVVIADSGSSGTNEVTIVGSTGEDTFTQSGNEVVANGATITLDSGVSAVSIDGGGGEDEFTAVGAPSVPTVVAGVGDTIIQGTSAADNIMLSPDNGPTTVKVRVNGVVVGTFQSPERLIVHAWDGDDDIQTTGNIRTSLSLYGDAGHDRVKGGDGNDVLLGGSGNDLLVGGGGRDLLIGGAGADRIVGNADDDILIADWTVHESSPSALSAIMDEWTRTDRTYNQRVDALMNGGGLNGSTVLNETTIFVDNAADILTGSAGLDWFVFDDTHDRITDLNASEFASDLDFILGP